MDPPKQPNMATSVSFSMVHKVVASMYSTDGPNAPAHLRGQFTTTSEPSFEERMEMHMLALFLAGSDRPALENTKQPTPTRLASSATEADKDFSKLPLHLRTPAPLASAAAETAKAATTGLPPHLRVPTSLTSSTAETFKNATTKLPPHLRTAARLAAEAAETAKDATTKLLLHVQIPDLPPNSTAETAQDTTKLPPYLRVPTPLTSSTAETVKHTTTKLLPHLRTPARLAAEAAEAVKDATVNLPPPFQLPLPLTISTTETFKNATTKLLPHMRTPARLEAEAAEAMKDATANLLPHLQLPVPLTSSTAETVKHTTTKFPPHLRTPARLAAEAAEASSIYQMIYVSPGVYIKQGPICRSFVFDLYACNVNTFCEKFSKTPAGCEKGAKCDMVHDAGLREAYRLDNLAKTQEKIKNAALKVADQSKSQLSIIKTGDGSVKKMRNAPVFDRSKLSWSQLDLLQWAEANLHPDTVAKYLAPPVVRKPKSDCGSDKGSFHYFGSLPGELQNMIWLFAMKFESNDVTVRFGKNDAGDKTWLQPGNLCRSYFEVRRDVRSLAQEFWPPTLPTIHSEPRIQFNNLRDRLVIYNEHISYLIPMVRAMSRETLNIPRWISIPLREYVAQPNITMTALCQFGSVSRIWFIVGDNYDDAPYVKQFSPEVLTKHMNATWKNIWKNFPRMQQRSVVCFHEIIPGMQAHLMRIDGLKWV